MKLKESTKIAGARPELVLGLVIADGVYKAFGFELVVTEVTGAKHSENSLHYVGLAADLRTAGIPEDFLPRVVETLKRALGADFDVILESNHIHMEFQPGYHP